MSRRKQAKPRAFLKLGDSAIDECDSANLLDPKEELLSGEEVESDDDEENTIMELDEENPDASAESPDQRPTAIECKSDLLRRNKKTPPAFKSQSTRNSSCDPVDGDESSSKSKQTNNRVLEEDSIDIADGQDLDEDDDDAVDDECSIGSFYSDLYSTHTSSSYSPSISDGTITPNSLHHQHHHHNHHNQHHHHHNHHQHQQHHLSHQLHLQQLHAHQQQPHCRYDSEEGNHHHHHQQQQQRVRNHNRLVSGAAINGAAVSGGDDDDDNDDDEQNEAVDAANSGEERISQSKTTTNTTGGAVAVLAVQRGDDGDDDDDDDNGDDEGEGRHRHSGGASHVIGGNEHSVRIPSKLRKIDRDSAKLKDKLTSDGIKSGTTMTTTTTTDGSYQCQFCDKSFPRLGYLKKHEQSHAEHLPFKCDYCARLFKHKRSRDRHTKLHTGDRRYRCPHCEAAFSRSDHLKIHMKTHDNQKPFQCTICNRGYNTAAALTSHMQNHKKQAALIAAGGNPQALNYSPRSTGSGSSNGSLYKRRYALVASAESSPSRQEYSKRIRASSMMSCGYCTKADFISIDQLNAHIQAMHDKEAASQVVSASGPTSVPNLFQLSCEYCTMKFPNIPSMFQHMRTTHIDRLTSPNSYFDHFNRLAASGTFSPRLAATTTPKSSSLSVRGEMETKIKLEDDISISSKVSESTIKQEEPTDLSRNKRRSQTPASPSTRESPPQTQAAVAVAEKPGMFFCNQCNAGLPDFESFRNHLKTHITNQGISSLVCHHCGLALREQSDYERHVISHFLITNSEFNCVAGGCNKTFSKTDELQQHLLDSHVQTMYKCSLCSDLFETKVTLQVHFSCTHTTETKIFRCSACMETFRNDQDFNIHVKTRHQSSINGNNSSSSSGSTTTTTTTIQCMFCRAICSSELEMHFHLAAHARQYRCPSCPETFHVEFLLDRHMQSHHGGVTHKESPEGVNNHIGNNHHINPIYMNAIFGKTGSLAAAQAAQNNNNNILDYNLAFAANINKGLFPAAGGAGGKFYNALQVDTTMKHPPPSSLMYGLGQRYFDTSRTLIDMYNKHQQEKSAAAAAAASSSGNFYISPKANSTEVPGNKPPMAIISDRSAPAAANGFSCGMCERNDFHTEAEVHSHRKIVHNLKTGVSLRCAYCSGNFKSRSELEHHMKTCHNTTGKHKCLICDEIFPSPAILAEHKLQHSKVGQSGKCSHCSKTLADVSDFKSHISEHHSSNTADGGGQLLPVQCICCRQTLNSDFEIGLHAKFHTKSSSSVTESVCALCLEAIPNAIGDAKVCDKCCRKHKFASSRERFDANGTRGPFIENRCNLCKMVLPHAQKLQEHLVEHTFAGCEDRGFICYICSAVFTAPSGLLGHMTEHGLNARPYDCNMCTQKFYFRAELDHHLVDHEVRERGAHPQHQHQQQRDVKTTATPIADSSRSNDKPKAQEIKMELVEERKNEEIIDDDDEYIEVEKFPGDVPANNVPAQAQKDDK